MKITCNREKMLHAFQTVAAIAPARSPKPILQNVKLEVAKDKATLMATDLEVGIRYEVTGIETDTPGAAVLPVARFGSILRESSDATFRIESGSEGTTIRGERSQFKLPSENPQDFPPIAEFGESSYYEISARLFRELIRRTIFATDNESSRYALGPAYAAVRQAAIVTSEESRGIDFTFGDGSLVLSGQTAEVGQSRIELPIAYDGPAISITLDPRFANDFFKVLEPEKTFTIDL